MTDEVVRPQILSPAQRRARARRRNLVVPQLPNQVHAPTQAKRYYAIFFEFMEWKQGGAALPDDYIFTNEEKRSIRPDDIHKYFCLMAYGKENPTPEDNPSLARSSTLTYWKKAISYFMDTNEHWNESHKSGNPTRLRIINRLLGAICW